jgi:transposase-like protein
MANVLSLSLQERIERLAAEWVAEQEDWDNETIDDIEEAVVDIGDRVARALLAEKLVRRLEPPAEPPPCPDCGGPSEAAGVRKRTLVTRRGKVPLTEAKYRCPKCRRHFFPSDPSAGH